jgi:homotetrameric cytidine deaminase
MRNVELKAIDPDPARTLALALALDGVSDQGILRQRDTYFAVAHGRLKLREEEHEGDEGTARAELIAYERPDDPAVRVSSYELVPSPTPARSRRAGRHRGPPGGGRQAAAAPAVARGPDPSRRGRGLGAFLELEAVAPPESDLSPEREKVAALRAALGIGDDALREGSYSDALLAAGALEAVDPQLLELARAAAANAYAPYSGFAVGAAVRTTDGRRYAGANVENAAYPQGQCAEASALGAMVAGGGGPVAEVVVAAGGGTVATPCGGCRQRLNEFTPPDAPIHLADAQRVRRTTSLAELLPLAFGPEALR